MSEIGSGGVVPADPDDVGSPPKQRLGDVTLVAVTGGPEGRGDPLGRRDLGVEVSTVRSITPSVLLARSLRVVAHCPNAVASEMGCRHR